MYNFLKKVDLVILTIIAVTVGAITVVNFFQPLDKIFPNYPLLTLFLVTMLAFNLIVSRLLMDAFSNDTMTLLKNISRGVHTPDFKIFNDSKEIETYLGKRMLEAKISICDLSWKATISEGFSASARQIAHEYMDKCISESSNRITYREIFIFSDPRRIEKLKRRILENKPGYSCRYFKEESSIPRLQFVIIDNEEVFFFGSSSDSLLCSFRGETLCKVFKSYYESCWKSAIVIKEGPNIIRKEYESICGQQKPKY